jgi:hypothetical protein
MVILGSANLTGVVAVLEEFLRDLSPHFTKFNPKRELDNHPNSVAKKLRKNLKFLLTFNDYLSILILT